MTGAKWQVRGQMTNEEQPSLRPLRSYGAHQSMQIVIKLSRLRESFFGPPRKSILDSRHDELPTQLPPMIANRTRHGSHRAYQSNVVVPVTLGEAAVAAFLNGQGRVADQSDDIWIEAAEQSERSVDIQAAPFRVA